MSVAGAKLPLNEKGAFVRKASAFRSHISKTEGIFKPELNRYHLYVSLACPWAHRALITRKLFKLESVIGLSIVHHHLDANGWRFDPKSDPNDISDGTKDHLYGYDRLKQLYFKANKDYDGRFTVPVLWDKKNETIVSNESAEIIRMLKEFDELSGIELDLYPEALRGEIDELNDWVYNNVNNGVYKAGFAGSQEAYDEAVTNLFNHLDKLESILTKKYSSNPDSKYYYIVGDQLTEADIRLYTTIIRFDSLYHQHFKCNIKMIRHDYPYLHKWLQKLYWQNEAFKSTTNFHHIKNHYVKSHGSINPLGIIPLGPVPNILPLSE